MGFRGFEVLWLWGRRTSVEVGGVGVGFGVSGFSVQVFRGFRMVKPLFIGCIALRILIDPLKEP